MGNKQSTSQKYVSTGSIRTQRQESVVPRRYEITPKLLQDDPISEMSYEILCAMDFGTSCSGYAFRFAKGHSGDPEKIFMNKNWGENVGMQSYKTPTSVLTGPGNKFVAFGYEAEDQYGRFDSDERKSHHLFKHFKMSLMDKELTRKLKIQSIDGHRMPALEIFTFAIKYLKDHILDTIAQQVISKPDVSMIRWVITVPAIWSNASKQFMREAAFKAGCIQEKYSRNLVLALEPEAASVWSKDIPVNTFAASTRETVQFQQGTQYIIVDAGGGTTDITVHKIVNNRRMEEIFTPSGGAWGSTQIDRNFEQLLSKIFGSDFINFLKMDHPSNWLTLMLKFESAKKLISRSNQRDLSIEISYNIYKLYQEKTANTIEDALREFRGSGISLKNGFLTISHNEAMKLVIPVISEIIQHLKKLLENPKCKVSAILLVGGFGESPIFKSELETLGLKVIVPEEAQLAVLRGAVVYGRNVNVIVSRVMNHTFGVDMEPRFKPNKHESTRKVTRDGIDYCSDVFQPYVTKGESKKSGESILKQFFPRTRDQPSMSFDIFYTDKPVLDDVEYVDSAHFKRLGGLTVMMPDTGAGLERKVNVEFFFGGTEIWVRGTDVTSGNVSEASIDCLLP